MPNKPVRQSAKFREQQYRKRMAAQGRAGSLDTAELGASESAPAPGENETEIGSVRFAGVGASAATATRPAPVVPRRTAAMPATPGALRTARGRIAAQMQEMNLADEMAFIRADIRRLLILAAVSFAILIVLSFIIR